MPIKDRVLSTKSWLRGEPHSGKPYRLVIEISNACNLRCSMCPRNIMVRKIEFMQPDLFEPLIRNNRHTLEFVGLNGYGEPMLHPYLFHYLDYCRGQKVKTGISTNCTLLDEEHQEMLLESPPDQLILAIDGVSADCYEKVRVGAKFDLVMQNVRRFLERCVTVKRKPLIYLQCIHMSQNSDEVRMFKEFFRGFPYDAIRIRQLTYSGRDCNDYLYFNDQESCYWLWHEPMVLASGDLVPCCQDVNGDLVLGNVSEKSLFELWSQGRIQALRRAHGEGNRNFIPVCKTCNMYQPGSLISIGATAFNTEVLNRLLPGIETIISKIRYN